MSFDGSMADSPRDRAAYFEGGGANSRVKEGRRRGGGGEVTASRKNSVTK